MKYRLCGVFLSLLLHEGVFAQKTVQFGAKAGYAFALNYGVKSAQYEVVPHGRHGAAGGFFLYFPVTGSFGVQYELLYVMKGSREKISLVEQPIEVNVWYDLDYVEIPVLFNLHTQRFGKWGMYAVSGIALSLLVNAHYRLEGTVEFNDGGTIVPISISDAYKIPYVDIFDFGFVYGGGIEFALKKAALFVEYRFTIGWNKIELPTYEGENSVGLRNQSYLLLFGVRL